VEQYAKNQYNINYYDIEKEMSDYFIRGELMVPKLSNLINSYVFSQAMDNSAKPDHRTLKTMENVMAEVDRGNLIPAFSYQDQLNEKSFTRAVGDSAVNHLERLRSAYKKLYQDAERRKDNITSNLIAEMGQEELISLKNRHHNTSLANIVTNQNIDENIIRAGNLFLVKVAPVFRLPESRLGRAQFYAPSKILGNLVIPTYMFNVLVILLMITILYIALYFDWLKNSISWFGRLKLQFR
jgi:hypothetical protein